MKGILEGFQVPTNSNYYRTVYDYNLPTGSTAQCETTKNQYTTAYDTSNTTLTTYKNSDCIKDNTVKYAENITTHLYDSLQPDSKVSLVKEYDSAKAIFNSYRDSVGVLQNARGPFDTYMRELETEEKTLNAEYIKIQQSIRAGRRRFLDADPQAGVTSVLGLQTTDDKVLLAFWICFAAGILALEFLILRKYGDILQFTNIQQKIAAVLVSLGLCMGIAHLFIRKFA